MKVVQTPKIIDNQGVKRRQKSGDSSRTWIQKIRLFMYRTFLTLLSISIIIVAWWIFRFTWQSSYFSLLKIDVNPTEHVSKDEIVIESGVLPRTNLSKVSVDKIAKRIQENPWVRSVTVIKRYPSNLQIRVSERVPVALIVGSQTLGIDEQGHLLPGLDGDAAKQLPLITVDENMISSESTVMKNVEIKQAILILSRLKKEHPELLNQVSEINVTHPDNIILYTQPDGTEVRLGNDKLEERLNNFYKIWKLAQERHLVHEYIDLRFDEQGVITKPKIIRKEKPAKNGSASA